MKSKLRLVDQDGYDQKFGTKLLTTPNSFGYWSYLPEKEKENEQRSNFD